VGGWDNDMDMLWRGEKEGGEKRQHIEFVCQHGEVGTGKKTKEGRGAQGAC